VFALTSLLFILQQGVPEFGVWNNPDAENYGFTNTFDVVRKVRRDGSSMDHISIQPKRPATSSGIGDRVRNEKSAVGYDQGEIWETQSTSSVPDNFVMQTRQSGNPLTRHQIEKIRHDGSPAKHQKVLTGRDDPKVRHERQRAGTSGMHYIFFLLFYSFLLC
jgi:hypothetical protein